MDSAVEIGIGVNAQIRVVIVAETVDNLVVGIIIVEIERRGVIEIIADPYHIGIRHEQIDDGRDIRAEHRKDHDESQ